VLAYTTEAGRPGRSRCARRPRASDKAGSDAHDAERGGPRRGRPPRRGGSRQRVAGSALEADVSLDLRESAQSSRGVRGLSRRRPSAAGGDRRAGAP
jgi:hypothetical protein